MCIESSIHAGCFEINIVCVAAERQIMPTNHDDYTVSLVPEAGCVSITPGQGFFHFRNGHIFQFLVFHASLCVF